MQCKNIISNGQINEKNEDNVLDIINSLREQQKWLHKLSIDDILEYFDMLSKFWKEEKSLNNKLPVWFAGDISKGFAPHLAALDEEIVDESFLFENFEKLKNFKKADKIKFFNLESNHAMTITGYNVDNNNIDSIYRTREFNTNGRIFKKLYHNGCPSYIISPPQFDLPVWVVS